jgi:hypothetical protein
MGAIPTLVLAGAVVSAPAAGASATPSLSQAKQTTLCATPTGQYCGQTLTALIPAGTQISVRCYHASAYYINVLAHTNQEGYVPQSAVSHAPSGLTDCDSASHHAIWAAAWAINYLGNSTAYPLGTCLPFVAAAWASAGDAIPGSSDPVTWWDAYANTGKYETGTSLTPPRGALVFWGGTPDDPPLSGDGHVAISVGNGWTISTAEGSTPSAGNDVHLLQISHRNASGTPERYPYLGWVMP